LPVEAEQIHANLRHALRELARKSLQGRGFGTGHLFVVDRRGNAVRDGAGDIDLDRHLGELLPDEGILRQRLAIALRLLGIVDEVFQDALGVHRALDASAFERQRRGGHVPAAILLTQEAGPWHPDIVEEDLVEVMPTGHVDQRLDGDPGALHIDEEVGNAFVLRHRGISAGQHKDPLRVLRAASPDLLAVDDEIVAVFNR
jgi:hypothetical protein